VPVRKLCLVFSLFFASISIAQNVPRSSHVWMIAEENHSYEDVVGNTAMPYYNQLIQEYGLAGQFYSDQHSSLPALMWFVAGAQVETNNSTVSCEHSEDNVVRELLKRGYSWRSYQEDLPYAGFQGLFATDKTYYRRHNPLIDFMDVCPGTGQDTNSVPFTQMATDFALGKTVNFAYITPNIDEDAHNGTLQESDEWLENNLPAILARPEFGPGGDGILFVVWDEGNLSSDNRCSARVRQGCGGRTPTLVIGPQVRSGYQSTITYHNESVLATVCAAMGLSPCPGAAGSAAPMADFFTGNSTNSVVISFPVDKATIVGQVHLIASASEDQPVSHTRVWDNGVELGSYGAQIDVIYKLATGSHTTTVEDFDSSGNLIHSASVTYEVQPLVIGAQIITPAPDEVFNAGKVQVVAHAIESVPISHLQIWDNGVKLGSYPGTSVDQDFTLAPGRHTVYVLVLDDQHNVIDHSNVTYLVR
jgi:hypothetical protein